LGTTVSVQCLPKLDLLANSLMSPIYFQEEEALELIEVHHANMISNSPGEPESNIFNKMLPPSSDEDVSQTGDDIPSSVHIFNGDDASSSSD